MKWLKSFAAACSRPFENEKQKLIFAALWTVLFSVIAHGYRYTQLMFNHDSLGTIDQIADVSLKIAIGRFFQIGYWMLRGRFTAPWFVGTMTTLFVTASVLLVVTLFRLENRFGIVLAGGILSTNITLMFTNASYVHESDTYMLAMLLACICVWCFRKWKWGFAAGILFFTGTMGLYQSYSQVTILLIIMLLCMDLLEGQEPLKVFLEGCKAVLMLLAGGGLYFAIYKLALAVTHIGMFRMDAVGSFGGFGLIGALKNAYVYVFRFFAKPFVYTTVLGCKPTRFVQVFCNGTVFAAILLLTLGVAFKKKLHPLSIALLAVLLVLMPLAGNFTGFVAGETGHELMVYALQLFYVFPIALAGRFGGELLKGSLRSAGAAVLALVLAFTLWDNLVYANQVYLKKSLEEEYTASVMTRLLNRMEMTPGYVPGTTPVIFVGKLKDSQYWLQARGFWDVGGVGVWEDLAITFDSCLENWFKYYQAAPVFIWDIEPDASDEAYAAMPCFPLEGCCQFMEDKLVVRLS